MNEWSFMIPKTLNFFIKTSNFISNPLRWTELNEMHIKQYQTMQEIGDV